jgi:hypothetical protein
MRTTVCLFWSEDTSFFPFVDFVQDHAMLWSLCTITEIGSENYFFGKNSTASCACSGFLSSVGWIDCLSSGVGNCIYGMIAACEDSFVRLPAPVCGGDR